MGYTIILVIICVVVFYIIDDIFKSIINTIKTNSPKVKSLNP